MTTYNNDNRYSQTYAVIDVETLNLNQLYESYKRLDPEPAELRWPFKSVCATALLVFTVDGDGLFEFVDLHAAAGDDEGALVRDLFDRLRMLPDAKVVTWGGLNADMPVLRVAAMRHHLRLPPQLVNDARRFRERCHLDLVAEYKAGARNFVHLSELATALRLPVKFADRASHVPKLLAEGKLDRLMDIALADVVSTALILQAHLEIHSELTSAAAAQIITLREVVRRRPQTRYADYLSRVERRLAAEAMADAEAFIASAA
ncbi:hypothetical protein [Sphingomonas sp. LHG3443-2]|uniref:hypothetical protein n=1 Tax=Sphingomonas sp. LHG3443-2 TaxID=2804639 RepID=UPI003CF192EA